MTFDLWLAAAAVMIGVPATAGALNAWHIRQDLKLVKSQVQNRHKTNFREEVTDIGDVVHALTKAISSLRDDVTAERHDAAIERHDQAIERHDQAIERHDALIERLLGGRS